MVEVEHIIPDIVFDWSLQFKTLVLLLGAVLLLVSSYIRPEVSIFLWGPLFLSGALLEWLIVATVYLEMGQLEAEIEDTYDEVKKAEEDILRTRDKVETARQQLQALKNETYDIQGSGAPFNSLEPGGSTSPEHVDVDSYDEPLEDRLRRLERKVEKLEHDPREF